MCESIPNWAGKLSENLLRGVGETVTRILADFESELVGQLGRECSGESATRKMIVQSLKVHLIPTQHQINEEKRLSGGSLRRACRGGGHCALEVVILRLGRISSQILFFRIDAKMMSSFLL